MAEIEHTKDNWPSERSNQSLLEQVNEQHLDVRQSSSVGKLPSIRTCKSTSPLPRRKIAIVASSSARGEKTKSTDLPPLQGYQSAESQKVEAKRSLSIPISPSLFRRHGSDSKEGKKRLGNISLKPLIPRNRTGIQRSPFRGKQFLSATDDSSEVDITNEVYFPGKSISLEDITLESRRSGDDEEKDVSLGKDRQLWSRHWYYARKSIGAIPQEKDFVDLELLSTTFRQRSKAVKGHGFAGDVAMYGSQEPDVMSNEKTLDGLLTLEERLASIEKQQGLSTRG